jgi:citrate lyase beta subunit
LLIRGKAEPSLGHNPLGAVAVVILLGLTAAAVGTGAFGGEAAEDVHELLGWTLLAMVAVHIGAVVVMSVMERENLVQAMLSGSKPRSRHLGASDALRPRVTGLVIALLVLAAAIYGVLQYDPQAFSLRSTESFEHRSDARAYPPAVEQHQHWD